jgi:hypothetical protein
MPPPLTASKAADATAVDPPGAVALVDDNVSYCVQCAGALGKVVLFGAYGWNAQPEPPALPRNVVRATDWPQALVCLHAHLDRLDENQAMLLG